MADPVNAIGLMSGTSMDGIDAAFIATDGEGMVEPGAALTIPYSDEMRSLLWHAIEQASGLETRPERGGVFQDAENALTEAHAEAVAALLDKASATGADIIGFHGQTILHRPDRSFTVQLGDGARLAELTGCTIVNDFRANDMAHGGQGAPFAPAYHMALAGRITERPAAFLNIGGVSNVTFISETDPIAFDAGPGNGLIDQWMMNERGLNMDEGGACAAQGTVELTMLEDLMDNPFFAAAPPKSLDRFNFSIAPVYNLSVEDGAATLTAFTAAAIAASQIHLPAAPAKWVVCGGGRLNPILMAALAERLPGEVVSAEEVDLRGDTVEAEAFAYLAVRASRGLPLSFPSTTGVSEPVCGGTIYRP